MPWKKNSYHEGGVRVGIAPFRGQIGIACDCMCSRGLVRIVRTRMSTELPLTCVYIGLYRYVDVDSVS